MQIIRPQEPKPIPQANVVSSGIGLRFAAMAFICLVIAAGLALLYR